MDQSTILKKGLRLLQQQLQPEEVLDHLLSVDILSQVEYDRCRDTKVKCDQTRELVMLLMCKGEQAYKEFCIVLNKDQRHVKQALDDIALGKGMYCQIRLCVAIIGTPIISKKSRCGVKRRKCVVIDKQSIVWLRKLLKCSCSNILV